MKNLKLSESRHDLEIVNYNLVIVEGIDRVRQHLRTRLWFFKGEWFLDTTFGVDYYGSILIKNPNLTTIASIIKATILDTLDVNQLLEYTQEYDAVRRELNVDFKVDTTFGIIDTTEVLP